MITRMLWRLVAIRWSLKSGPRIEHEGATEAWADELRAMRHD